jgi:Zn-dependent peptidase ImmA (M78 family)
MDHREREANAFAAALLMPSHLVRAEIQQHDFDFGDEDALNSLASTFQVSAQSMAYRLSKLRLFAISS